MCRWGKGSVTHPIREIRGGGYSPIIISVKQTLETTQTIITTTQQTKFLIGVEFPGCYTWAGLGECILDIRGETPTEPGNTLGLCGDLLWSIPGKPDEG